MNKRILLISVVLSAAICINSYAADDTVADLLAIYDDSVYTPSQDDLKQFRSEMDEYNKLLSKEKQIQSYNDSVMDAHAQYEVALEQAQFQTQALLNQANDCANYIEDNIFGDWKSLVQKDAEYKQCFNGAEVLLEKVNSMQIPPLQASVQNQIDQKALSIEEKKAKVEMPDIERTDDDYVLGDVYKIHNILNSKYVLLSDYGSRINKETRYTIEYHNGIDIQSVVGEDVTSLFNGEVIEISNSERLGRYVRIKHGPGIITMIANLQSTCVQPNQIIKQYDKIGTANDFVYVSLFINGRSVNPKTLLERGDIGA